MGRAVPTRRARAVPTSEESGEGGYEEEGQSEVSRHPAARAQVRLGQFSRAAGGGRVVIKSIPKETVRTISSLRHLKHEVCVLRELRDARARPRVEGGGAAAEAAAPPRRAAVSASSVVVVGRAHSLDRRSDGGGGGAGGSKHPPEWHRDAQRQRRFAFGRDGHAHDVRHGAAEEVRADRLADDDEAEERRRRQRRWKRRRRSLRTR